jgi:hypothetical protein
MKSTPSGTVLDRGGVLRRRTETGYETDGHDLGSDSFRFAVER